MRKRGGDKVESEDVPLLTKDSTPALDRADNRLRPQHEILGSGTQVGRYVVERRLGSGGMGDVYLAHDPALNRAVALKLIRSDLLEVGRIEAFLSEAKTTACFSHSNIVVIHEVGTHQGQPFLALEYLDGPTLLEWLSDAAPSLEEVLRVAYDVAQALVAAHERDIVHRDLKPSNVVVTKDGRARVVDFGLAAALGDHGAHPGGTPRYMAPEQRRGEAPTPGVDIWALGLILNELLTQQLEFTETWTASDSSADQYSLDVTPAPESLRALVNAALEDDPELRPTAVIFRDAIARRLEEMSVERDLAQTRQLLGRDNEREGLLKEAIALRRGGRGGIVGIEGEAGLGKTLLLLDFVRRAQANGLQVVKGSASAVHRHTPFHAWRTALTELLESNGCWDSETGNALPANLPHDLHPFLPLLERVMRTSEAESWWAVTLDVETRAEVTIRVLTEVLTRITSGPLVIVIDDWQWADSASWRLARSMAMLIPRLLLVLCYRPLDPASSERKALEQLPRFKSITLPPLSDGTVRRIVQNRASIAEPTGELTRLVVQYAAGNPLFAEELTALAQHSGTSDLGAGTTLRSVLKQRLKSLSGATLDVLMSASVVGQQFDGSLLQKLHEPEVVRAALRQLLDVGLLRRTEGGYAFWHELTCSVTYETLGKEERCARHRAVAGALERGGGEAARQYGSLANHWQKAGDLERAVYHSERAAEQALNTGAHEEAARFLRLCLRFQPHIASRISPPEQPIRWRRLLAETYYALGLLKEAKEEALRALALAGRDFPAWRIGYRARTAGLFMRALLLAGRNPRRRRTESSPDSWRLEIARALGIVAIASWFFNEDDPTHYAALASFCEAHRCGPSRTLVRASSRLGCELGLRGWSWAGARFEMVAREVAEALDDPHATAYACMTDALYRVGVADWDRVQNDVDECQSICEEIRDDTNWCNAQAIRYWAYHYRGVPEEAKHAAQDLWDRAEATGNDQHRGWGARDVALELLDAGDPEAAQRTLEDALGLLTSAGRRIELIPARGVLAVAWMRLGEQDRAVEEVSETLRLLTYSKSQNSHSILEGCSGVAEVLLTAQSERWPHKTAAGWRRAVGQAIKTLGDYSASFPVGMPRYALWTGVAAHNRGRRAQARRLWKRGLNEAARLGLGRDLGLLSGRLRSETTNATRA